MSRVTGLPVTATNGRRWTVIAGLYFFVSASVMLSLLSPVVRALRAVLGLPGDVTALVLAAPVLPVGAVVWGALVEREGNHSYGRGATAGLVTALATVAVWVAVGAFRWGPELVLVGGVVVGFVLAVSVPAGTVSALALTYARRRAGGDADDAGRTE